MSDTVDSRKQLALYVIGCSILGIALACGRKAIKSGSGDDDSTDGATATS